MSTFPDCPYCGHRPVLTTGAVIYPSRRDLRGKWFYLCRACDAYVGCHPNSKRPLGRLADAKLRRLKRQVHAAFDPLWKSGEMTRSKAYEYLANALGIRQEKCHIGMFDEERCREAIRLLTG